MIRRLILVDIENVVGGAIITTQDAMSARVMIEALVEPTSNDLVVIGMSHMGLFSVFHAWGKARILVQSGPNGADLKLLDELSQADIARRFNEIVLISGDGIFTDRVVELTTLGKQVTVVAPVDGCAWRLEMAATSTVKFERTLQDERLSA